MYYEPVFWVLREILRELLLEIGHGKSTSYVDLKRTLVLLKNEKDCPAAALFPQE
jgi:hypothetical protein